jgi:DNA-binding transcriptional MerR regulator
MEWSIQEVARLSGVTSRTLRHYGDVGLLSASRTGAGGLRYYDADALTRLQRILLLRELGLGIPAIAESLGRESDDIRALKIHLRALAEEKNRLDRQIASVALTIRKRKGGEQLMAEDMFDGFDHTVFRDEVEDRWGADAYASGDAWWRSMSAGQKAGFAEQHRAIAADYASARAAGDPVASDRVQAIVKRHVDWLNLTASVTGGVVTAERLRGYGAMYVGDPRFARNYGGPEGAGFVRDAFENYAERSL